MDFKHLEYFYEVCTHKSISQAAKNLFISQQALSRSIQKLEQELGYSLFVRGKKGIQLTENGYYLYQQFKPVLMNYRHMLSNIRSLYHPSEELTLYCSPGMLWMIDLDLFMQFQELYPYVSFKTEALGDSDCEEIIKNSPHALGLISMLQPPYEQMVCYHTVKNHPLWLFFRRNHPLSQLQGITFEDLNNYNCLSGTKASHYRDFYIQQAAQCQCNPHLGFETEDVGLIIDLLRRTDQISFGTLPANAKQFLADIAVKPFPTVSGKPAIASSTFIYQDYEKLPPIAQELIRFIEQKIG